MNPLACIGAELTWFPVTPVTVCWFGARARCAGGLEFAEITTVRAAVACVVAPLAVTTYVWLQGCVGVPESTPVLALNCIPGGGAEEREYVTELWKPLGVQAPDAEYVPTVPFTFCWNGERVRAGAEPPVI